jgi:dihydrofolate reductase
MRKVVVYMLTSLDGVAEEPGDWMTDSGQAIFDNLARVIGTQDTILLGRGTYDYWVDFWPDSGPEPFHSFINSTEKHVFTSRPLEQQWANTLVVAGTAEDHVRGLRQGEGRRHRTARQHPTGTVVGGRGPRRRVPPRRFGYRGGTGRTAVQRPPEAAAETAGRHLNPRRIAAARLRVTDTRTRPES